MSAPHPGILAKLRLLMCAWCALLSAGWAAAACVIGPGQAGCVDALARWDEVHQRWEEVTESSLVLVGSDQRLTAARQDMSLQVGAHIRVNHGAKAHVRTPCGVAHLYEGAELEITAEEGLICTFKQWIGRVYYDATAPLVVRTNAAQAAVQSTGLLVSVVDETTVQVDNGMVLVSGSRNEEPVRVSGRGCLGRHGCEQVLVQEGAVGPVERWSRSSLGADLRPSWLLGHPTWGVGLLGGFAYVERVEAGGRWGAAQADLSLTHRFNARWVVGLDVSTSRVPDEGLQRVTQTVFFGRTTLDDTTALGLGLLSSQDLSWSASAAAVERQRLGVVYSARAMQHVTRRLGVFADVRIGWMGMPGQVVVDLRAGYGFVF